jgi:uncharacterized cupin superfamily protein
MADTNRLRAPALDPATLETVNRLYPPPYHKVMEGRARRVLGDPLGLTQFGINLTTLQPGGKSSLRHWHTGEDEFVFIVEGEVTLITDEGEQTLRAGDCAGFPANNGNGHHLVNNSGTPARFLEIGHRSSGEEVHYTEADLHLVRDESGRRFLHKDGTPY